MGLDHSKRYGKFTSSNIHKLCKNGKGEFKFGAPALTYIEEKRIERRLESSLDVGGHSQAMAWGNFLEFVIFDLLGIEYKITSHTTTAHPDPHYGKFWSGSNDLLVPGKKVGEIKCYQKKKFAQYADCLMMKDVKYFKDNFAEEYWQIVSNCVIHQVPVGEAIVYMPYESEIEGIREMVRNFDGPDQWKYRYIVETPTEELPVLKDGGYYSNVVKFEFQVPQEDIDFLYERMDKAIILLTRETFKR